MNTIDSTENYTFMQALAKLKDGKCHGIRPANNSWFVFLKPDSQIPTNPELCWFQKPTSGIGIDNYTERWHLVFRELNSDEKILEIKKIVGDGVMDRAEKMSKIIGVIWD